MKLGYRARSTRGKVYDEAPEVLGGTSFVLVDLNEPIKSPHPRWLRDRLIEIGKECEFPDCTSVAETNFYSKPHYFYVCLGHYDELTSSDEVTCRMAISRIRRYQLDAILGTSFGRDETQPTRIEKLATQAATVQSSSPLKLRRFGQL